MMFDSDTVAAISTSLGNSGIHIIRISGSSSFDVINRIFKCGKSFNDFDADRVDSHTIHYGYIFDNDSCIDEVLVSVFKAPNSFTSEDTVEINCHGGSYVVKRILDIVINNGARLAMPGEFSKRAFLNGRIDLTQAEAVMNIINSRNENALKASVRQIKGDIKDYIIMLRDKLLGIIASIEAALDDPEHYILDEEFYSTTYSTINYVNDNVISLYNRSKDGVIVNEGVKTVIVGKPNVGKSSIMNYLLNDDKAIVTDIPGTTRDIIEYSVNLSNVTLNLVDTAGIHNTDDVIENIGIDRTRSYINDADLILCVFDISSSSSHEDHDIYNLIKDKKHICIFNKCDLTKCNDTFYEEIKDDNCVDFSVKKDIGYDKLISLISELFYNNILDIDNELYITNVRHMNLLSNVVDSLANVKNGLNDRISEDFLTIDLLDAYNYLGDIIGETTSDDVVDKIFSDFCMGK